MTSDAALLLRGPIARADIDGVCDRALAVVDGCGPGPVVCDVGALEPTAVTVEALARLQLEVRRRGRRVVFRHACDDLRRLLVLTGLNDVLPCATNRRSPDASALEPVWEAEQREEPRRVEEERDPGDPAL